MATVGSILASVRRALHRAGIDTAAIDARRIVAHVLALSPEEILARPARAVAAADCERVQAVCRRRIVGEPLAYLVGSREFWSLPFIVSSATLVPRPDSETMIEASLAWVGVRRNDALRVLDLGTGSGCLLLSLLHELPAATGVGVDRSFAALSVARANAGALGLSRRASFICGDWGGALSGDYDLIVANPPYIPRHAWHTLPTSVRRFEPAIALDGGVDGLAAYRAVLADLSRLLSPDGAAFLEVGAGQAQEVISLLPDCLQVMEIRQDLGGIPRSLGILRRSFLLDKKSLESKRFPTRVESTARVSPEAAPTGAIDLPIS